MAQRSEAPVVLKVNDLAELITAVPYALGFQPSESLVVVALKGPRKRISFTLRLDLLDPEHDKHVAQMCADRMRHAKAVAALVFVYTSAPHQPGPLPRSELVTAIESAMKMPVEDAFLVDGDRVWSYTCFDPRCCPSQGRVVRADDPGAVNVAAAHALNGDVVLPDRDALVATAAPIGGVTARSMHAAIERAFDGVVADDDVLGTSLALVDRLCADYEDDHITLRHDDAANLAVRLHDVVFRDVLIGRLSRRNEALERVMTDVARLAQPPYDAPAATMLAVVSYLRGCGVVAIAAAERALASDPSYSLARLIVQAIEGQIDPKHMRRIWSKFRL